MKKISIIVPVYNAERYLRRCIESVINQSYRNLEIILVNDCSTDGSLSICEEFAKIDERVRIVNKAVNEGVGCARNSGLEAVTGEFVGFIDNDDYVDVDTYRDLMDIAVKYNSDIVQCKHFLVYDDKILGTCDTNAIELYDNVNAIEELLCKPSSLNVYWNKIYKKELFDLVGISAIPGEEETDIKTMYKLLFYSKIIVSYDKSYYYWYRHNGNQTLTLVRKPDFWNWLMDSLGDRQLFIKEKCPEILSSLYAKDLYTFISVMYYYKGRDIVKNKDVLHVLSSKLSFLYKEQKKVMPLLKRIIYFGPVIVTKCYTLYLLVSFLCSNESILHKVLKKMLKLVGLTDSQWKEVKKEVFS